MIVLPTVVGLLALAGVAALLYVIWSNPVTSAITIGSILLGIGILAGIAYWYDKTKDERAIKKLERKNAPPKDPGMVQTFIRAKKSKVCPLIEVVNTNES